MTILTAKASMMKTSPTAFASLGSMAQIFPNVVTISIPCSICRISEVSWSNINQQVKLNFFFFLQDKEKVEIVEIVKIFYYYDRIVNNQYDLCPHHLIQKYKLSTLSPTNFLCVAGTYKYIYIYIYY